MDRKEIADSLREVLSAFGDRGYARALGRCVLGNFRTGLALVPCRRDGVWYPRKRPRSRA